MIFLLPPPLDASVISSTIPAGEFDENEHREHKTEI
jgi:hypothetical protein